MRVAVTGTPGTGKTTASTLLADRIAADPALPVSEVVHLADLLEAEGLYTGVDEDRGSLVADLEAIECTLADRDAVLVESHLAHHIAADRVIVLRCHPRTLETRLRERDMAPASVAENATSEALDVVFAEAVDRHGTDRIYEIETTDRQPREVADAIESVLRDARDPGPIPVDYTGYLA